MHSFGVVGVFSEIFDSMFFVFHYIMYNGFIYTVNTLISHKIKTTDTYWLIMHFSASLKSMIHP